MVDVDNEVELDMRLREELVAAGESESEPGTPKGDRERKNTKFPMQRMHGHKSRG